MPNTETYNDDVVRLFLLAAAVWGVVGMSIGVYAAAELAWPALNFDVPWLSFSRLRPTAHQSRVIFAFGGSALFAHRPTTSCSAPATSRLVLRQRWPPSPSGAGSW